MTINAQLRVDLKKLFDATEKPSLLQEKNTLIDNLDVADNQEKLQNAWQAIIKSLNPEYYVARDNTKKFYAVQPNIEALVNAVTAAEVALNGNLANNQSLAEDMTQFIFKVSNFYSIASTLEADNFDICSKWLEKAHKFITENNLLESKQHSIWYNLIGGHKSREYQMGRSIERPEASVADFKNAVRIRKEILGNSLDNPNDIDLRHVQMCLASTLLQDAMWCVLHNGFTDDVKQSCVEARQYLSELTDARLILANGKPDLYRRAGCAQSFGYLQMLEGHFKDARESMHRASELMKESIGATGATGQLSAILNDEANSLIALYAITNDDSYFQKAKKCFQESISLSEGQFEQMYADVARKSLNQLDSTNIEEYHATKLANIVMHSLTSSPMPKLSVNTNSGEALHGKETEEVAPTNVLKQKM